MVEEYFNHQLEEALRRAVEHRYDPEKGKAVVMAVHKALTKSLVVENERIHSESGLVNELAVENPDDREIELWIENDLRIRLQGNPFVTQDEQGKNPRPATVLEFAMRVYEAYASKS